MATGNSGDVIISQTSFYGGQGTDLKIGIKNSFGDAECMDARKNPSNITVLPGSRKLSDPDLQGLIVNMTQTPNGMRWGVSTNGALYKIDLSNDITQAATLAGWTNGTFGDLTYWPLTDRIYITGIDRVYAYGPILKAGAPSVITITAAASTYPTVAQILVKDRDGKWTGGVTSRWAFKSGSTTTYTVPNAAISEADADKCIFLPDQSPMTRIAVKFAAKGAGNVTLIIHDGQNNVVATATVAAANVSTTDVTNFDFSATDVGEYKNFGTEYHIHLTATTTGFTVETYEASLLYGLHFYYYAALLDTTLKKCHTILNWAGSKLLIGNGQYLVDWLPSGLTSVNGSEFQRHRVIIENGMEITSLTSNDEYVVLGGEKVSTEPGRIYQQGMLGFWDGFADAINFKIDTPMGEPKSLYTNQNITYCIIAGSIYAYTGGKMLTKIRTILDSQSEFTGLNDQTDVYPSCMTVRRGILLMAYPSTTNLTTMRHGIYSWGSIDKNYPNSFYYSYNIPEATGNYNTSAKQYTLGGVWNFGDTMYFSYNIHDNTSNTDSFNLAIVDNTSKPASAFKYESLSYDGGVPWKDKLAMRIGIATDKLPDGTEIRLKYKIDGDPWVVDTHVATKDAIESYFEINKRFRQIQFGFNGTNSAAVTKSPLISGIALNARDLGEEGKVQK